MDVTTRHIEAIPRGNLRVSRSEFVAVWSAAEDLCDEQARRGAGDWYTTGVALTCRWLAGAVAPTIVGGMAPARSPVTHRRATAHEELIEAECLAAERQAIRHPGGIEGRPGWLDGIVTTLNWAWRGSGVPPLDIGHAAAG